MASTTIYSSWSPEWLPSGAQAKRKYRSFLTYTVTTTDTEVKVAWSAGINLNLTIGISSWICSVSGTDQTTVTKNPVATKFNDKTTYTYARGTWTWKRGTSAKSVKITSKMTKTSGTGSNVSVTATIPVPALAKVTISFNANGGSGTVASIPTYYGVSTKLASGGYSKTGYKLTGWNTKADGTGTNYALGANISTTASITLYAIWKTTYVSPIIDNLVAFRTLDNSGGANPTVTASGTTGFCELKVTGGNAYTVLSVKVQFGEAAAKNAALSNGTYCTYSDVDTIPKESEKPVYITVIVKGDDGMQRTLTAQTYISKAELSVDISANGKSVAIGGEARDNQVENELLVFGNLEVRGIEYSMTKAEFQELETLLGGGSS